MNTQKTPAEVASIKRTREYYRGAAPSYLREGRLVTFQEYVEASAVSFSSTFESFDSIRTFSYQLERGYDSHSGRQLWRIVCEGVEVESGVGNYA